MQGSDLRVERAAPEDAAHILGLQRLAYQSEARLYDDWNLPPLVQTLESLQAEFANSVILKALDRGQLAGRQSDGRLLAMPPQPVDKLGGGGRHARQHFLDITAKGEAAA